MVLWSSDEIEEKEVLLDDVTHYRAPSSPDLRPSKHFDVRS